MSEPVLSRRQQVLEVLLRRLQRITTANGFTTNAGQAAFLMLAPRTGPGDARELVAIRVGDDEIQGQQAQVAYRLPLECQALVDAEQLDAPWTSVEAVLRDLKRAVELPQEGTAEKALAEGLRFREADGGRLLAGFLERGQTVTLERDPGSAVVGVSITYIAPLVERWGEP